MGLGGKYFLLAGEVQGRRGVFRSNNIENNIIVCWYCVGLKYIREGKCQFIFLHVICLQSEQEVYHIYQNHI